jgi:hypothetical protein
MTIRERSVLIEHLDFWKSVTQLQVTIHVVIDLCVHPIYTFSMAAPSRFTATATKTLKNASASRVAHRTFASQTSNSVAPLRTIPRGNTVCLREVQRLRSNSRRTAISSQEQIRLFSQSSSRQKLKTIDQIRARNKGGVRSPQKPRSETGSEGIGTWIRG